MTCRADDRDLLIFKALCGLSEVADACHDAPIEPTLAIRFAVAFLYANSNGERWVFEEYLETIGRQPRVGECQAAYVRSTNARSCIEGMVSRLSQWACPDVPHRMIRRVASGENANAVWRRELAQQAERDAMAVETERAARDAMARRRATKG